MPQPRFLVLLSGTVLLLGTALLVLTSNSKQAKGTATYVGQQSCMSSGCHADFKDDIYQGAAEYKKTMHANIHNRPNSGNVVIERWFREKKTLTYVESRVHQSPGDTLFVDLDKGEKEDDYLMRLRTTGPYPDSTIWMRVTYNYGGNGWLQRFLIEVNGSYYISPFQYLLPHYRETNSDTGSVFFIDPRRWYSVDGEKDAIVFHDFKSQAFFNESWDKRCATCHLNGFDVTKVMTSQGDTQWVAKWPGVDEGDSAKTDINLAIGCESCHGPGSLHVSDPQNKEYQKDISPKMWDPTEQSRVWTDRKLEICDQCHNRHSSTDLLHTYQYNDATGEPYLPGLPLEDFVHDLVKDAQYWEDGKTSYAHHQTGQDYWRSGHYGKHTFKNGCYDCHTVHNDTELPYQLNRNWYVLQEGEGCAATGCHDGYAAVETRSDGLVYNLHTKHLNEHSQCVNCHYTKTATISPSFSSTFEFSDHSDKVIRPTVTKQYITGGFTGMLNTCASSCHRNGYGERNRPDAFDQNVSIKWGNPGVTPMRAPDYGITDKYFNIWKETSDIALADSLWEGYQRLYAEYISAVRIGEEDENRGSAVTSVSPNPASDVVHIRFNLLRTEKIKLEVYTAQGELVRVIADLKHEAGSYEDEWDGFDELNRSVPSGAYFIRLTGESFSSTKSVMLVR